MKQPLELSTSDLKQLGRQLRHARRSQDISQDEVSRAVGIKQSAVSAFENGHTDAVAREKLNAWRSFLELNSETATELHESENAIKLAACLNYQCSSIVENYVGKASKRPTPERVTPKQNHCRHCGEDLFRYCQNPQCGMGINEGAYCMGCGRAYLD